MKRLMRAVDPGDVPLNDLQQSIIDAISKFYVDDPAMTAMAITSTTITTAADAKEILKRAEKLRHPGPTLAL